MKGQPDEYGVTWSASKSGKIQIALGADKDFLGRHEIDVWAIYTGTHDLVPGSSRCFTGPDRAAEARDYANELWAKR